MKFKKLVSSAVLSTALLAAVAGGASANTDVAEPIQVAALTKTDKLTSPYKKQIFEMFNIGALLPEDDMIDPKASINRGGFIDTLAYAHESKFGFPEGSDYYEEIIKAGFISANPDNTAMLKRGEFFVALGKVYALYNPGAVADVSVLNKFKDLPQLSQADKEALAHIVKAGIVTGNNGVISFDKEITVEHYAKVTVGFNELVAGK